MLGGLLGLLVCLAVVMVAVGRCVSLGWTVGELDILTGAFSGHVIGGGAAKPPVISGSSRCPLTEASAPAHLFQSMVKLPTWKRSELLRTPPKPMD